MSKQITKDDSYFFGKKASMQYHGNSIAFGKYIKSPTTKGRGNVLINCSSIQELF
jgi:hypothetical protein